MAQKTPLYQVFLVLSVISFCIFISLYLLASKRNLELIEAYSQLEISGSKSFGTIKEFNLIEKQSLKNHIYTYSVPDEAGRLTEIVEYVDPITNKKLRIGDTVVVTRKTIKLLGKSTLISRINGNTSLIPHNILIEKLSLFGIIFSTLLGFVSLFMFKRRI